MQDHHHRSLPGGDIMSRRMFVAAGLGAFATYAIVREAAATGSRRDRRLPAIRWIDRQDELARALRAGAVSHVAWHDEVDRLAADVEIAQLLAEIGHGATTSHTPFMRDPVKRDVVFVDAAGAPRRLSYAAATFSFGPENVITPHAHKHLATAHMVIAGTMRIRTFDRVGDEAGAIVIRPTADYIGGIGHAAAMTTEKDNVHWFTPGSTGGGTTFDVIIDRLDAGEEDYLIQPIDPLGGERRADGTIVAPLVSFASAMQRYSAHV